MCKPSRNLHGTTSELKAELAQLQAENKRLKAKSPKKKQAKTPKIAVLTVVNNSLEVKVIGEKPNSAERFFLQNEDVLN